jgi:phosphatidylserine/phosphatidylglycerophosphate/cardiolipin synthase-like enzyme
MHQLLKYFTENFDQIREGKIKPDIKFQISQLNRDHREEMRHLLFQEAKSLPSGMSGIETIMWLQKCFELVDKYSFRFNNVYFSPGPEIQHTIYSLLKEAKSSVHLCIFTITDKRLSNEIISCFNRGLKVKLITDDEKTIAKGSEIFKLEKAGIPIKTDQSRYHMHNKFGIIDGRIALTGSFNWTYTATKHNQENLLATSNFDIVQQYQAEFSRLWKTMFWF